MTSSNDRSVNTAHKTVPAPTAPGPRKALPPAAERALAEAAQRRAAIDQRTAERPKEVAGPSGPEPTRYGDWEKKGLASDF
jgi:hypothetical protein